MHTSSRLAAIRERLLALANQAGEVRTELATEAASGDAGHADPYRLADVHRQATEEVVTTQLLGLESGVERKAWRRSSASTAGRTACASGAGSGSRRAGWK